MLWLMGMLCISALTFDRISRAQSYQTTIRSKEDTSPDSQVLRYNRDDLKKSSTSNLAQFLQQQSGIPGIEGFSNSAPSTLYLRGAEASQVLVVVDGIVVNDPSDPSNGFDLSSIPLSDLASVELRPGPQASIAGSQSMAGVIVIESQDWLEENRDSRLKVLQSYGSQKTWHQSLKWMAKSGANSQYAFKFFRNTSEGNSAANIPGGDRDGYKKQGFESAYKIKYNERLSQNFSYHLEEQKLDLDSGPFLDSTNAASRSLNHRLGTAVDWQGDQRSVKGGTSYSWMKREFQDYPIETTYRGSTLASHVAFGQQSEYLGTQLLLNHNHEEISVNGSELVNKKSRDSVGLNPSVVFGPKVAKLFLAYRFDYRNRGATPGRGSHTYQVQPEYLYSPLDLTFFARYSTGFKAPTLYQLHTPVYGNPQLRSEKSDSVELGFRQFTTPLVDAQFSLFHTNYRELLSFDNASMRFTNEGTARVRGADLNLKQALSPFLSFHSSFRWLWSEHKASGRALARRPGFNSSIGMHMNLGWRFGINPEWRYVGSRYSSNIESEKLPSHQLTDFSLSYLPPKGSLGSSKVSFVIRNLFNKKYQEIRGYQAPGRQYFANLDLIF